MQLHPKQAEESIHHVRFTPASGGKATVDRQTKKDKEILFYFIPCERREGLSVFRRRTAFYLNSGGGLICAAGTEEFHSGWIYFCNTSAALILHLLCF